MKISSLLKLIRTIKYIHGDKFYLNSIFFIMIFIILSSLEVLSIGIVYLYIQAFYDLKNFILSINNNFSFLSNFINENNLIILLTLTILFLFLLKNILFIYLNYIILNYSYNREILLKKRIFKNTLYVDYNYFSTNDSSDYLNLITGYVSSYSSSLIAFLKIISESLIAITITVGLLIINPLITVILFFTLIFLSIIFYFIFYRNLSIYGRLTGQFTVKQYQLVSSLLLGLKEIKILGIQKKLSTQFNKVLINLKNNILKERFVQYLPRSFFEVIIILILLSVVLFFYYVLKIDQLKLALPLISAYLLAAYRLTPSLVTILSSLSIIKFSKTHIEAIFNHLINHISELEKNNSSTSIKVNETFDSLDLKDVSFSYNQNIQVLDNINLTINKNSFVAITGKSGEGKTTLINLILGILEPTSGKIEFNKKNIIYTLENWRKKIAYIPQDLFLINSSIRENISFNFDQSITNDKKLNDAINKSQLYKYINNLDRGIDYNVGDKGILLSGGQKQRIAIARALYFDRDILVLDESTNALDSQTEDKILQELREIKKTKTIIIITHRQDILKYCDAIYNISNKKLNKVK